MQMTYRVPVRGRRLVIATLPLAAGLAVLGGPPGVPAGLKAGEAQARPCPSPKANPGAIGPAQASRTVACLINRRRAHRGLPMMKQRAALRSTAVRHSQRMVNRGCFAHLCPGEDPLIKRVRQHTSYLPCKCKFRLAQTIGGGANARGRPIRIVRNWIRAKRNRKVLFSRNLRHVGIGVVWGGPGAPGNDSFGTYTGVFGYKR